MGGVSKATPRQERDELISAVESTPITSWALYGLDACAGLLVAAGRACRCMCECERVDELLLSGVNVEPGRVVQALFMRLCAEDPRRNWSQN